MRKSLSWSLFVVLLITFATTGEAQVISTFAGMGTAGYTGNGGSASVAQLSRPTSIVADDSGNVYIADYDNNVIRKVTTDGLINTLAGNGTPGYSGDGGSSTAAQLSAPSGIAVDVAGNLYILLQELAQLGHQAMAAWLFWPD
ncbi:MAG: hypothetical protein H7257_05020 [Taibaiella sp.]|nr:hypothetical protein [Taibaiella sp.]